MGQIRTEYNTKHDEITYSVVGWMSSSCPASDEGIEYVKVRTSVVPVSWFVYKEKSASSKEFAWLTGIVTLSQSPAGDKLL